MFNFLIIREMQIKLMNNTNFAKYQRRESHGEDAEPMVAGIVTYSRLRIIYPDSASCR